MPSLLPSSPTLPYDAFGAVGNLPAAMDSTFVYENTHGHSSIRFYIDVPTGGTVVFEGSCDNGTHYGGIFLRSLRDNSFATTTLSDCYSGSILGMSHFRVRVTVGGSTGGTVQGRASASVGTIEGIESPSPSTFSLDLARGRIQDMSHTNLFGRNPDIDVGTEDIWGGGGVWVAPTAARVHNLVSSSLNDAAAGTGLRTLYVAGLDANYAVVSETVVLNGTSSVPTLNAYLYIEHLHGFTAGSGGVNAGTITATAVVDGTVSIVMLPGKGHSQFGIYVVPSGHTAYMNRWYAGMQGGSGSKLDVDLFSRPFGGSNVVEATIPLQQGGVTFGEIRYDPPKVFGARTTIRLSGTSDTNNVSAHAGFNLILVTD